MIEKKIEIQIDENEIVQAIKKKVSNDVIKGMSNVIVAEIDEKIERRTRTLIQDHKINGTINFLFGETIAKLVKDEVDSNFRRLKGGIEKQYDLYNINREELDARQRAFADGIALASIVLSYESLDPNEIKSDIFDRIAERVARRIRLDKIAYETISQKTQEKYQEVGG